MSYLFICLWVFPCRFRGTRSLIGHPLRLIEGLWRLPRLVLSLGQFRSLGRNRNRVPAQYLLPRPRPRRPQDLRRARALELRRGLNPDR